MNISTLVTALRTPPPPAATIDTAAVLGAALAYRSAGISIIPIKIDGTKMPAWSMLPAVTMPQGDVRRPWRPFQSRLPAEQEVRSWYGGWLTPGIAVITGKVSGGLECLDFDNAESFEPWAASVLAVAPGLLEGLVLVRSPRPGVHVYFRSATAGPNTKLAQKMVMNPTTNLSEIKTLIETRGEGGYILAPPSPGCCHPSGRPYVYLTTRTLCNASVISAEERSLLLDSARALNEIQPPAAASVPNRIPSRIPDRHLPGDDYDYRADWHRLLRRYGWTYAGPGAGGEEHWRRPGKTNGTSATLNYEGSNLLHVFSSNASPLEAERSYSPFQFLTVMQYDGDFERAARALRVQGYGQQPLPVGRRRDRRRR